MVSTVASSDEVCGEEVAAKSFAAKISVRSFAKLFRAYHDAST